MLATGFRSARGIALQFIGLAVIVTACEPDVGVRRPDITAVGAPRATLMSSCGLSYTSTTSEDNGLDGFDMPIVNEVADICETWTGSDYQFQVSIRYSDSPEFGASGSSPTVMYSAGSLTNYDAYGQLQSVSDAGGSTFAMLNASSDEVQASYDDPYYGIVGGGSDDGCTPPDCYATLRAPAPIAPEGGKPVAAGVRAASARNVPDASALRHGLKRRGVRFLLDNFDEVASGRADRRKFTRRIGDRVRSIELDQATQLVVVDEEDSPNERVRAEQQWKAAGHGMYVLARRDVDVVDDADSNQPKHHKTTVRISNVKWEDQQ